MFEVSGEVLIQGIINGICLGGIYILLALGFTLILSVMNIVHFAHGEVYMIGAFIAFYFSVYQGLNIFLAILISMIAAGGLGLIMERVVYRPLGGQFLKVVCAAIGMMIILQTIVLITFGVGQQHMPNFWLGTFSFQEWVIPRDRAVAVLICLALTSLLYLLLKRSRFGQGIIATAQNRKGALLQGVNPNLMSAMAMGIGSILAAVGGTLAGSIFILSPFMGTLALTKGIAIIVIGGMGSLVGAIIGGIILGLIDSLVPIAFGPGPTIIAPLVIVILILIIKPQGLFGHA